MALRALSIVIAIIALTYMLRAIWKTLPMLIWTLYPTAIHSWFLTHLESDQAIAASEKLQEWLRRLEAMGFSKIGIKAERPPLWGRTTLELALQQTTHMAPSSWTIAAAHSACISTRP
jgi:hypothetical protein